MEALKWKRKKVKCYKCGEEIDFLTEYSKGWIRYDIFIGNDGQEDYEARDPIHDDMPVVEYDCPECGVSLFNNNEDAIAFLRGEIECYREQGL